MGIELYWDNDAHTVMLCEVRGAWTWDEMFATLEKIKQSTDASPVEIAAILDVTQGVSLPGGGLFSPATRDNARKMIKMGEGGTGQIVVVGASPFIKTIYHAALTLDRKTLSNFAFTNTVEEARAVLARRMTANPTV